MDEPARLRAPEAGPGRWDGPRRPALVREVGRRGRPEQAQPALQPGPARGRVPPPVRSPWSLVPPRERRPPPGLRPTLPGRLRRTDRRLPPGRERSVRPAARGSPWLQRPGTAGRSCFLQCHQYLLGGDAALGERAGDEREERQGAGDGNHSEDRRQTEEDAGGTGGSCPSLTDGGEGAGEGASCPRVAGDQA